MKIQVHANGEQGFTTLFVIFMIAFMVAIVGANTSALFQLKREVKLLEKKHQKYWDQKNAEAQKKNDSKVQTH